MIKRITLVCLFMFSVIGLKSQTHCFHHMGHFDQMNNFQSRDWYQYYTFQGDWLYPSEFASPYVDFYGQIVCQAYVYSGEKNKDGEKVYRYCDPKNLDPVIGDPTLNYFMGQGDYYVVSADTNKILHVTNYGEQQVDYYEKCPDRNCKKGIQLENNTIPTTRQY